MPRADDIVQRLWGLCNILRDDGITYHQYVTELTYLLFLKLAKETETEAELPEGCRWSDLQASSGDELRARYKRLLADLGERGSGRVRAIFATASTSLRQAKHLEQLVMGIDKLDWYSARREGLGAMYEGLLEKNASETKAGAGQYFTPRELIESIVALVKPAPGEVVQDPAAGTGGFLIVADRFVKARADASRRPTFYGVELVPEVHRMALMNAILHDIEGEIVLGDALGPAGAALPLADVILTNPPFGAKRGGGPPARSDFAFPTSNKQLGFLQHIYRGLALGGRAAVVLPDNVLFEEGVGQKIRKGLMDVCDLHTILRLPTGIFYSQAVKTNVLFFARGERGPGATEAVWIYDMRTKLPSFGKRSPLKREHFEAFERAFGEDPYGKSERREDGQGSAGRWRRFTREEIARRGDNLDISWLRDDPGESLGDPSGPSEVAAAIMGELKAAIDDLAELTAMLDGSSSGPRSS